MSAAPYRTQSDGRPGRESELERRRYLLFAGTQQPPMGGLGDLVDTFTTEEAARCAFRTIRLRTSSTASWAQLAVVDEDQGVRPLCWFGIGAEPGRLRPVLDTPAAEETGASAARSHPSNRMHLMVAAMVAVAAAILAVYVDSDGITPPGRQPAVTVAVEEHR